MLEAVQREFNAGQASNKRISLADLIVLGGRAAVEQAASDTGHPVQVPFASGRMDASREQTDVATFAVLEPVADGFRNYRNAGYRCRPEELLVDRAQLLILTPAEMTVLVGGMRALDASLDQSSHGVFTHRPGVLSNDFFVNLLELATRWLPLDEEKELFEGVDRKTGEVRWCATRVDLIFGADSELRALSAVYAGENAGEKFVRDFAAA